MADMNCPYCGAECEVCHDDDHGYAEDQLHEHECHDCGKTFVFETAIVLYYTAKKADCLNDKEHNWQPTHTWPIEATRGHCPDCGAERKATAEDMAAAVDFHNKLQAQEG